MAEPAKLNNVLNGMPVWVKMFSYFGAPMLFASYFMMKDAGYIGVKADHSDHVAMTQVLERICVRLSDTPGERSDCMR